MTIVLIEHDLDFVARVADRVIVLHGGKVVESGTPAEVSASPGRARGLRRDGGHVKVDVEGLRAGYGSATILEEVGFGVPEHGALAIVGRNGMGKSTLLKAIMGYLKPSQGTVTVAGRDVTGWPTYRITRMGVSYAAQEKSLFGELSVEENLSVGKGRRCPPEVRDEVVGYFPVLGQRLGQKAGTLSGGEQKMLTLAKALVAVPDLLVLDEISDGLGPAVITAGRRRAPRPARAARLHDPHGRAEPRPQPRGRRSASPCSSSAA